jgi:putative FmdB family regulatory protein
MPIYEYECQACQHRFEEWQKMSDKPIKVCPKCKARKVEKLISQTSFQLKGGGWYSDLYASAKPGASTSGAESSNASSSSGSSGGAAKTTESKGKGKKGTVKAAAA